MRTLYSWYPVRCCCQPMKLFGFVRVAEGARCVTDFNGKTHPIELKRMAEAKYHVLSFDFSYPNPMAPEIREEVAVYSDDRPIEFWRDIPEFVESLVRE